MAALGAATAATVLQEEDAAGLLQIHTVDGYYFESSSRKEEPVCFSTLPLRRLDAAATANDVPEGNNNNEVLNLRGFAFAGRGRRLRVVKTVVAWRLELDGEQPEFFMLLSRADAGGEGAGAWLRLGKPAKVYERTAKAALMTAQVLHFVRRNPDRPETDLWIHLRRASRYLARSPVALSRLFLLLVRRCFGIWCGLWSC